MKKYLIPTLLMANALVSCTDEKSGYQGELIGVPTRADVVLSSEDAAVVQAMNSKGFDFFNQMVNDNCSGFNFSPLGLTLCAGMYANALPEYGVSEFLKWYGVDNMAAFNSSTDRLICKLYQCNADNDFALANSIWYQDLATPTSDYKEVLHRNFYAEVNKCSNSDVEIIGKWMNAKTNGVLKDQLGRYDLSGCDFSMINCLYFNDSWQFEFSAKKTQKSDFYGLNGKSTVDMMYGSSMSAKYCEEQGNLMLQLPFKHDAELLILMPGKGIDILDFCSTLSYTAWCEMENGLTQSRFDLAMPKFKVDGAQNLTDILDKNGLPISSAPLPGVGLEKAHSQAVQITSFSVDEKGATAAATTIIGAVGSPAPESLWFEINRPFVYFLKSRTTSAVLMMGVVTDIH